MNQLVSTRWVGAVLAASVGMATPAAAQEAAEGVSALRTELMDLQAENAQRQARIDTLERRLQALESAAGLGAGAYPVPDAAQAQMRGRGGRTSMGRFVGTDVVAMLPDEQGGSGPTSTPDAYARTAASDEEPLRKEPAQSQAVATVTEAEQGFFSRRFTLEAGLTYSHFDDARLNLSGFLALDSIFLGLINLEESTADIATVDFSARYRLTDRLQVDAAIPYLFRYSNYQSGGAGSSAAGLQEASRTDHGIGDVSVGASYRLVREKAYWPDIVINARAKAPTGRHPFGVELETIPDSGDNLAIPTALATGSGVWGASLGVSMLKTLDPMVIFGSLTYFRNFENDFDDLDETLGDQPGKAKLGDAIQFGGGVAFALNDRSSLSLSFTQRIVERTRLTRTGGRQIRVVGSQANVGVFNIGATFALSNRISLLTTLGVGMTADAPDMVFSLRLPFTF